MHMSKQANKLINFSCGTFNIEDPRCKKWERDLSKPYPRCCNEFICAEIVELTNDEVMPERGDTNDMKSDDAEVLKTFDD